MKIFIIGAISFDKLEVSKRDRDTIMRSIFSEASLLFFTEKSCSD